MHNFLRRELPCPFPYMGIQLFLVGLAFPQSRKLFFLCPIWISHPMAQGLPFLITEYGDSTPPVVTSTGIDCMRTGIITMISFAFILPLV
jgi:hypothetical protein